MYYGQGDYYKGDYYTGDPGIFGTLGRVIGGAVGGFIRGGPTGAIVGAVGGTAVALRKNLAEETLAAGGSASAYTPAMKARHAEILARGGAGTIQRGGLAMQRLAAGAGGGLMLPPGAGRMRRLHWNKSAYFTRGGGTSQWPRGVQLHPAGTVAVPSRRMNVANARALRKAIRRLSGFGKIVHRIKRAVGRANSAVGNVRRGGKRAPAARRR